MSKLEQEIKTFEKHRAEFEKTHPGKFVLIQGADFIGAFDTFENAAEEALRRFQDKEFLIRQIGADMPKLSTAIIYGLTSANTSTSLSGPK